MIVTSATPRIGHSINGKLLELLQPGFEVVYDTHKPFGSLVFSLRFGKALDDRTLLVALRQWLYRRRTAMTVYAKWKIDTGPCGVSSQTCPTARQDNKAILMAC